MRLAATGHRRTIAGPPMTMSDASDMIARWTSGSEGQNGQSFRLSAEISGSPGSTDIVARRGHQLLVRMCLSGSTLSPTHYIGCLHSLDWTTGLDYWTGLLDSLIRMRNSAFAARYILLAYAHREPLHYKV